MRRVVLLALLAVFLAEEALGTKAPQKNVPPSTATARSDSSSMSSSSSSSADAANKAPKVPETWLWNVPPSNLMLAVGCFIVAIIAPFVVKRLLHRLRFMPAVQASSYGTFQRIPTAFASSEEATKPLGVTHTPFPGMPITNEDLPPEITFIWDKICWKLVHDELYVPLGLTAFVACTAIGFELLRLPIQTHAWRLREIADDFSTAAFAVCLVFTLWRLIDVARKVTGRQWWIARTKMQSMYDEISSKVCLVVKIVGTLVTLVAVTGLFSSNQWYSKLFVAFISALILGLCAWILFELSDVAQEQLSAMQLMYYNIYQLGETIEFYTRDKGQYKGVVRDTDTRVTHLEAPDGRPIAVPNSLVLESIVTNHTRSLETVAFQLFLSADTPVPELRKLAQNLRELLSHHPATTTPILHEGSSASLPASNVGFQSGATGSMIPLTCNVFLQKQVCGSVCMP